MTRRTLTVGKTTVLLYATNAHRLELSDVLYPCGDMHDLHLNPERTFSLTDVEDIILAIIRIERHK